MDRNGSNGGTPDHFQNDEEYATRHHIWVQRQETRHAFSRLETRLDDTFEEFRQQNARLQKQHDDNQGVLATMSAQVAQLFIRSNQRNSHASSSSRRTRSEAPRMQTTTPLKGMIQELLDKTQVIMIQELRNTIQAIMTLHQELRTKMQVIMLLFQEHQGKIP